MTTSSIATMTTSEIATKLVELCRSGQYETAHKKLYAEDAISIEPQASPEFEKETKGLQAIEEKGKKFDSMVETMHSTAVSEPLVSGNVIAFTLTMDVTMKGQGRFTMEELCVYKVKDGKIVSEEFFM
jgi:ketosteroid isomerase-like protein